MDTVLCEANYKGNRKSDGRRDLKRKRENRKQRKCKYRDQKDIERK
jgi:hypothetical protein